MIDKIMRCFRFFFVMQRVVDDDRLPVAAQRVRLRIVALFHQAMNHRRWRVGRDGVNVLLRPHSRYAQRSSVFQSTDLLLVEVGTSTFSPWAFFSQVDPSVSVSVSVSNRS